MNERKTMQENILEINDLNVAYTRNSFQQLLLNNISFSVPRYKVTGIAGESGSGKSLSALSLLKLYPPGIKYISGSILLNEENKSLDIATLDNDKIRNIRGKKISMIFQEPMSSLNPSLICGFQVKEALMAHEKISSKIASEKVKYLFNEVKLPDPENIYSSYPHQLSGGQRQRVMIAMALISNPLLLIADEPTTALDVTVQKKILDLFHEIIENYKLSIIFITHNLQLLQSFAHKIIIMRQGKVMEAGDSEKIFHFPENPYTQGLIACQPSLDRRPERLLTVQDFEAGVKIKNIEEKKFLKTENLKEFISINNLSVYFPRTTSLFTDRKSSFTAVNNIELKVYKGETLGIVGESGCGKTSLGKAILKLLPGISGEIIYKGKDIINIKGKELQNFRKQVQVVFQDPYSSLNPLQRAGDIILEAMKVHLKHLSPKERKDKCLMLFEKAGLSPDSINKYPHQFSGGQRQRIGIARCLALEPELIILDEAVSALDVSVQAQILNLLNELKEEFGLTYIFISHDLALVKYMSDRIIVMKNGNIIERGEASEIYKNPVSEYTKTLIASVPGIDKIRRSTYS